VEREPSAVRPHAPRHQGELASHRVDLRPSKRLLDSCNGYDALMETIPMSLRPALRANRTTPRASPRRAEPSSVLQVTQTAGEALAKDAMDIKELDRFVRVRLSSREIGEPSADAELRRGRQVAVDVALLAHDPSEWAEFWATACADGTALQSGPVDASVVEEARRLLWVWAGPPTRRLPLREAWQAIAGPYPALAAAIRTSPVHSLR